MKACWRERHGQINNCVMYKRAVAVFSWRASESSVIDGLFREAGGET